MSVKMTSFWLRACETVIYVLAFLLPLAFYLQTYDVTAIKTTILEAGAVVLAFAWLFKGLERGRWEIPDAARPLAFPALALLAWTVLRFCAAPYKIAALPGFLRQVVCLAVYMIALLEFGGVQNVRRLFGWISAAAWIAGLYGLAQRLGVDPLPWNGAFGARVFSTLGNPESFGVFLALCIPMTLTLRLDPERDLFLRRLDAGLLILIMANLALARSLLAFLAVERIALAAAIGFPLFLPSRKSLRVAAFSIVLLVVAVIAQYKGGGASPFWLNEAIGGYDAVQKIAADSLWFGRGPGSFAVFSAQILANPSQDAQSFLRTTVAELGLVGVGLSLWLFAALAAAAWSARRRFVREGALGESCYAAGLAVTTLGCLGSWAFLPGSLLWPLAGMLGGLTVLARRGAFVSVLPLPLRESARRRIYAPAMLVMIGLLVFPIRCFDSEIENNLALYHARHGEFDRAIAHCDRVLPGADSYVASRFTKGNAYLAMNRPQDALETYAAVETLSPDYGGVHYQKATAYARLEDWGAAAESYARQAQFEPNFAANYAGWTEAALHLGDLGAAEAAATKAVALEPNDPAHKIALAQVYAQEKRLAQIQKQKIHVSKPVNAAPKKPQG